MREGSSVIGRMERLSSLDGLFLAIEDRCNQMHFGTVAIFDGATPSHDEVLGFLAGRIALVPRCRQRVRVPAGPLGRPVWIDDVHFDLGDQVHTVSLVGRSPADLEGLVAELLASPMDRSRPLWELWVVDGLTGDHWALVAKVHHCMVDGIAGSDLLGVILAERPDGTTAGPDRWVASPEPSAVGFAWFSVLGALGSLAGRVRGAVGALRHLDRSWDRARSIVHAAKRLWYRQRHVRTSLVGPIGTRRRWTRVAVPFEEVDRIRAGLGGTVNDVVVAAVACGFRDLLVDRGEPVDGRTVTAMIPVSLRAPTERGEAGNRVANVHASLPVGNPDPRSMLQAVHGQLEELKRSREIEATSLLLRIGDYVPRFVADRVARAVLHRQRNVETVITNVPGPRVPLYFGRHRMVDGYPVAPIGGLVRITVAIWSYGDHLSFGITGDGDTAPDIERLGQGISRGFAGLLAAATPT